MFLKNVNVHKFRGIYDKDMKKDMAFVSLYLENRECTDIYNQEIISHMLQVRSITLQDNFFLFQIL
jgi:hypothetical protein